MDWRTRLSWWGLLARQRWLYGLSLAALVLSVLTLVVEPTFSSVAALFGVFVGGLAVVMDARAWRRAQHELLIRSRTNDDSEAWTLAPELLRDGYVLDRAQPAVVTARELNRALREEADCSLEKVSRRIPDAPAGVHKALILRSEFRESGAVLFNGAKVAQVTDLRLADGELQPIRVREARYFDGLVTNEFAENEIIDRFETPVFRGSSLFVEEGQILALRHSGASNGIGCSTLALTNDDVLIVSRQGQGSRLEPGRLAPSGSGSADWADASGAPTLRRLVIGAAERELLEECGLPSESVVRTDLLAYARLVHRGGKPEYFCFTLLNVPFERVRVRRQERRLMFRHRALRNRGPEELRSDLARFARAEWSELTAVLKVHLRLLDEALAEGWSPFSTGRREGTSG